MIIIVHVVCSRVKYEYCVIITIHILCGSVVAMGGDGTVNQVLNGLLNRSQKEQEVDIRPGFTPVKALIPLGIIPVGKTNHIAYTLMGTADPITASLHIIFGMELPQWASGKVSVWMHEIRRLKRLDA